METSDALEKLNQEYQAAWAAIFEREAEAAGKRHQGLISDKQFQKIRQETEEKITQLKTDEKFKNIAERANAAMLDKVNKTIAGLTELLGGSLLSEEQLAAQRKLLSLGFGGPSVDLAIKSYIQQRDSLNLIR